MNKCALDTEMGVANNPKLKPLGYWQSPTLPVIALCDSTGYVCFVVSGAGAAGFSGG